MVAPKTAPAAELDVDAAQVRALLGSQMPEALQFDLGDRYEGWDCVTWRLGEHWAVRLPRHQSAADMQATEHTWLARLAPHLPFAVPAPVRLGKPSETFPWRWAVVRWVPGTTAYEAPLTLAGAHDLGAGLRAIHQPAPPEAPRNVMRSTSLLQRAARTIKRLEDVAMRASELGWHVDFESASRMYERGAAATRPQATWTHLDLHCGNVITRGGRLSGIVDWTHASAGDPASDLGQALVLLPSQYWDALIEGYGGIDASTFTRARAEALAYALILANIPQAPFPAFGWAALESLSLARRTR